MPKGFSFSPRRYSKLAAFLPLFFPFSSAFGQVSLLFQKNGSAAGDQFGYSVAGAGDLNRDGRPDFIVGAPYNDLNGPDNGAAYVYSGFDGSLRFQIPQHSPFSPPPFFGFSVAGSGGDIGNPVDGTPDFIVGEPNRQASVYVGPIGFVVQFRGSDGSEDGFKAGDENDARLGWSVSGVGDLDGDGLANFIAGAPGVNVAGVEAGAAYVYNCWCRPGILFQYFGEAAGDNFGYSVAGLGDVNGDGKPDFAVGAPYADSGGYNDVGAVYVYSGQNGTLLYRKYGSAAGDNFGISVSNAGDVNGDGRADFIVGAYLADPGGLTDAGSLFVYSGLDGSLLFQKNGLAAGDNFGAAVAGAGDGDGDGQADFIVGAPSADPGGLIDAGSAYVYSGRTGALIAQMNGSAAGDVFGFSVAGAEDVDGDGLADVIIGAPRALNYAGSAYVYRLVSGFSGHEVILQVSFPLPFQLRLDKRYNRVDVWYRNLSDFDVYDVMLLVKLPKYFRATFRRDTVPFGGIDWTHLDAGDTVDNYQLYPIWTYKIRAHSGGAIEVILPGVPGLVHFLLGFVIEAYSAGGGEGFADDGDFLSIASRRSSWLYNLICRTYSELRSSGDTLTYSVPTDIFATNVEDWLQNRANQLKITAPAAHLVAACISEILGVTDILEVRKIAQRIPKIVSDLLDPEKTDAADVDGSLASHLPPSAAEVCVNKPPDNGCPMSETCPSVFPEPFPEQNYPIRGALCIASYNKSENHHQRDCDGCTKNDQGCYVPHGAVDFTAQLGAPVYATASGSVVDFGCHGSRRGNTCFGNAGYDPNDPHKGFGCFIVIRQFIGENDWYDYLYAHLTDWNPRLNLDDTVKVGDLIGRSGNTGNAFNAPQPHVHYEVRHGGCNGPCDKTKKVCPYLGQNVPPSCPDWVNRVKKLFTSATTEGIYSGDPNVKFGPQGLGQNHYLASQNLMPYEIEFENVDTATAAAQTISVADTLNITAIDPASFRFNTIGFGDISITASDSSMSFSQEVDLRPAKPLLVRVNAQFDSSSGILSCQLTAIDPSTGLPPEDPQLGVLPPNRVPPEGQGWISYTASLRNNLSTGTVISNRAHIVFDNNPSMATQDWVNTIDRSAPSSRIWQAIYNTTDMGIRVSWIGTDSGAGIQNYSVFVDRGFGIEPWLTEVAETTAVYPAANFQPYCFFVQALDSVGNLEVRNDSIRVCATLMKGDLNSSGTLNPSDVVLMLNCVFLGVLPPAGYSGCGISCICDVNCTNDATSADLVLELNAVFIESSFPCP